MTTAIPLEERIRTAKLLRNIFSGCALVFVVLALSLFTSGNVPQSKIMLVSLIPAIGGVWSLIGAAFMQKALRDLSSGDFAPPENVERKGPYLLELLSACGVVIGMMIGAAALASDVAAARLAEDMASGSTYFDMSQAQPAEQMVEVFAKPVRKAVFVPAAEFGDRKGVVCAESMDGSLTLYGFGTSIGSPTMGEVNMNPDIEAVAPAFCGEAFVQLR